MPDRSKKVPLYNLESRLRAMGQEDNSFVIGIFDCCREAYDEGIFPPVQTRGGNANEERDEGVVKGQHVFLIFGCPSNRGVPAASKIATQFFEVIEQAKADNECILLPDAANVF